MKLLPMAVFLLLAATTFAATRLSVVSLPEPVHPLAEVETNVVFSAGAQGDNLWKLSIELEASAGNCVEVVFGTDVNNDGVLDVDEGVLCVGWDCGEWFLRDRMSGAIECVDVTAGSRRLDWTVRLNGDRSVRSIDGNVFSGAVSPACFNPDWNMARVVSRGAESLRVESKVTVDALTLRIR